MNAANKYELPCLFTMCEKEIKAKIDVENVVDTLIMADMHSSMVLKKACLNFVHLNTAAVRKTCKWPTLKDRYGTLLVDTLEYSMKVHTV